MLRHSYYANKKRPIVKLSINQSPSPNGGKPFETESLKQLLVEELQDLLHAEGQLVAALPKMADAAHNPKLKEAFAKQHLQQD